MVHQQALKGICARRNGINGGSLQEARLEGGNRLCRKFLASIFRHKPNLVPMINDKITLNFCVRENQNPLF